MATDGDAGLACAHVPRLGISPGDLRIHRAKGTPEHRRTSSDKSAPQQPCPVSHTGTDQEGRIRHTSWPIRVYI